MRFIPLIGTAWPLLRGVCLIHPSSMSTPLGPCVFPRQSARGSCCVRAACSECPMPCCARLHAQGKTQQYGTLERAWGSEPGSGHAWAGTGMAAAPQARVKGSSPARGLPHCSQPHPSSLVLPLCPTPLCAEPDGRRSFWPSRVLLTAR